MKHWIMTVSGIKFDFDNPTVDMIDIKDIAHALSLLCRFTGQCDNFYSIAVHSLHTAKELVKRKEDKRVVLTGLLHDATEAYLGDVSSPLKSILSEYRLIEEQVSGIIAQKFNLIWPLPEVIHKVDLRMLKTEKSLLFMSEATKNTWWNDKIDNLEPYSGITLQRGTPHAVEIEFLEMFHSLV